MAELKKKKNIFYFPSHTEPKNKNTNQKRMKFSSVCEREPKIIYKEDETRKNRKYWDLKLLL